MEVDEPIQSSSDDGAEKGKKRQRRSARTLRKSVAMNVSSSEEGRLQTVTLTKKTSQKLKSTPDILVPVKKLSSADLDLTDESENEELEAGVL